MKYKLNSKNSFEALRSPVTYILILAGILVIFSLYVAYSCSETARDRLYPRFEQYEDGSFIMVDKYGNTKMGCMSDGLCQEDRQ